MLKRSSSYSLLHSVWNGFMMAHSAWSHILDNFCELIFCYQYILLFVYINCKSNDCHNFLFCYVEEINESVVYLMYVVTVSGIFSSCYLFYPKKRVNVLCCFERVCFMVHLHYFGKQYCFPQ